MELAAYALEHGFELGTGGHGIGAGSRTPAREACARHPTEALSGTQSDAGVRREASRPRLGSLLCKQYARSKPAWSARFFENRHPQGRLQADKSAELLDLWMTRVEGGGGLLRA